MIQLFSQIVGLDLLSFPRYVFKNFPEEDKRRLVIFSDGRAYGSTIKVFLGSKTPNSSNEPVSALLLACHKLPDAAAIGNAPRLEANDLLLASRAAKKLQVELMNQVDEIILAKDSQLLIGMVRGFSEVLVPYLSGRGSGGEY